MVRQQTAALLDAMVEDHERATGPWEIEWIVLPEIFCLSAGALAQTLFVLNGLQVDEKKMRANLDLTKGLIVSEAVMMGLGPYLGRQYAHDLVYDICRKVVATGRPLARSARRERGNHQTPRPRCADEIVRSGKLSRRGRRHGGSSAGDARQRVPHSAAAAFAAACSRTNFVTAR